MKIWSVFFLALMALSAYAGERRYVVATTVNLRDQPSTDATIVAKLPIATEVEILKSDEHWAHVVVQSSHEHGRRGWLATEFLTSERPTVKGLLKLSEDSTPDEYVRRRTWAERAIALDRINAEELKQRTIAKGEADRLYPFVDSNSIKANGIFKADSTIVFQTSGGIKALDPKTRKWAYGVAADSKFSTEALEGPIWNSSYDGSPPLAIPPWYEQRGFNPSFLRDPNNKSSLPMIFVIRDIEGAMWHSQDIIDVNRSIVFRLPYEGFTSFFVDGRVAWLGSLKGVTAIDLDTAERTDYVTLPGTSEIVGVIASGNNIYYGTSNVGAFLINRKSGAVQSIDALNRAAHRHGRLEDMVLLNGKLFMLVSPVDRSGWVADKKNTLLGIYDIRSSATTLHDTKVNFANRLLSQNGRVIGYGRKEHWIEGGQRSGVFGGAFEYDVKNGKLVQLLDQPLNYLSAKDSVGLSIDGGMYGNVSDTSRPHSLTMIGETGGGMAVRLYTRTKDRLIEHEATYEKPDPSAEHTKLILEMRTFENARSQALAKQVMEILPNLRVRPETIAIPKGKVTVIRPTK